MKKGQKKRTWTPEEKAEIVGKHLGRGVRTRSWTEYDRKG